MSKEQPPIPQMHAEEDQEQGLRARAAADEHGGTRIGLPKTQSSTPDEEL
jgi:hypothetical protein